MYQCSSGIPLSIHTDMGAQSESKLFQELCKLLGIKKTRKTPFRPQSSGFIERTNRSILDMLTVFVSEHRNDWDKYVPLFLMAHRSSVHLA